MADAPYRYHRQAALDLLHSERRLSRKEGGFLGQLAVDPSPLSGKQANWLSKLLEKAGLPQVAQEEAP